jgi:hypothetical protein
MWQQYRKSLVSMQVFIAMITLGVFFLLGHQWATAAAFFVVMQISAVIGAVWACRVKALIQRSADRLPLQSN